jgi:hypothetical protein
MCLPRKRLWLIHQQFQDPSSRRLIRLCGALHSWRSQELDLAPGSFVIDHDRITLNRPWFSVLADVPDKIPKDVDPGMGKGTSKFGHRVGPEDGTRPEKTVNSRNDFAPVFQVTDIYGVSLGGLIREQRSRFRLGLGFQDVGDCGLS